MAATVEAPSAFDTHHDDVIHDAQVDFFGRRLATASSDRTIRIFQINQKQTETLMSILSGHEGPVWQVAWAHPKFGSILASCSYDGTVIIWQENKKDTAADSHVRSPIDDKNHSQWAKLKSHRVHESSVNSISFAPHEYGLHLACASSDGKISVLSMNDNGDWTSQIFTAHQTGCNSVSWCPSAKPSSLLSLDFSNKNTNTVELGPMVLASGGCDNFVKLWKFSTEENQWVQDASLQGHSDWVRDVCWRPNIGAVRHLLVSCSQDSTVLLWYQSDQGTWMKRSLKPEPFADTIWRASFSEYGNLLAVSCGDNTVTIWRENPQTGNWDQVGTVDENVTETVKISEPLAVELPESTPVPDLSYGQSQAAGAEDNYVYESENVQGYETTTSQASNYEASQDNYYVTDSQYQYTNEQQQFDTAVEASNQFEPVSETPEVQIDYSAQQSYDQSQMDFSSQSVQPSFDQNQIEFSEQHTYQAADVHGDGQGFYTENSIEVTHELQQFNYEAPIETATDYSQYNQDPQYEQQINYSYDNSNFYPTSQPVEDTNQYQYDESQYYQNEQKPLAYQEYQNSEQDPQYKYESDPFQPANGTDQPDNSLL